MRRMIMGTVAAGLCLAAMSACTSHSPAGVGAGRTVAGSGSPVPVGTTAAGSSSGAPVSTAATSATVPSDANALVAYVHGGRVVAAAGYEVGAAGSGEPMQPTAGEAEFTTPSGNISCGLALEGVGVMCSVSSYTYPTPSRPASCHLNYAAGWISLDPSGVSRGLCLGGPPFPPVSHTLAYGSTLASGRVACRSEAAFLACADTRSGHGFVVSRSELHTY